jgi:hypothetical protein
MAESSFRSNGARKGRISRKTQLAKYFLHGVAFSLLFFILAIVWALVFGVLIVLGSFIGLIIGIVLLFFIVGGLNAFLSEIVWNLSIDGWQSILTCGFYLTVILVIVHIPVAYALIYDPPNIIVSMVLFVIYAFIDGFLARELAPLWKYKGEVKLIDTEVVEDKIKLMNLDELHEFENLLNRQYEQMASAQEPPEKLTSLIYLRGKVESEIKSRTAMNTLAKSAKS